MGDTEVIMNPEEINKLAKSLQRIDSTMSNPNRVWFQGKDLYFDVTFDLENNGDIHWFEFTWEGKALSWAKDYSCLEIGYTNELDTHDRRYAASKTIQKTDNLSNSEFIEFIKFVKAVLRDRADEPLFRKALDILNNY